MVSCWTEFNPEAPLETSVLFCIFLEHGSIVQTPVPLSSSDSKLWNLAGRPTWWEIGFQKTEEQVYGNLHA